MMDTKLRNLTFESYKNRSLKEDRLEGGLRINFNNQHQPNKPLISIVTVVYNAEKYLEMTIQSVIEQGYKNIEYIIIDGGSNDGTLEIIRKHQNFINYWISEGDAGIYDAMNKGISLCSGVVVGLINAGDIYTKDAINTIVEQYNNDYTKILVGRCKVMLDQPNKWIISSGETSNLPYKTLPHSSVFVSLCVYKENGLFDIDFKISADYDFFCRCYQNGVRFSHVDKVIAIASPPGVSSNYYLLEIECFKIRLRHNLPLYNCVTMSLFSFLTITIHKMLEFLRLWKFVEGYRHGKIQS